MAHGYYVHTIRRTMLPKTCQGRHWAVRTAFTSEVKYFVYLCILYALYQCLDTFGGLYFTEGFLRILELHLSGDQSFYVHLSARNQVDSKLVVARAIPDMMVSYDQTVDCK